jgi:hypothetical protein
MNRDLHGNPMLSTHPIIPQGRTRTVKISHLALLLLALVIGWKVIRTDWMVTVPHYYCYNPNRPAAEGRADYHIPLPVSPLWQPPQIAEVDWGRAGCESSPREPDGTAKIRLNWILIGIKMAFAYLASFPMVMVLAILGRSLGR